MRISDWSSDVCSSDLPPESLRPSCRKPISSRRTDAGRGRACQAGVKPRLRGRVAAPSDHRRAGTAGRPPPTGRRRPRSEEHTSELQSLMRISYAVFCLKKKKKQHTHTYNLYIDYNEHTLLT